MRMACARATWDMASLPVPSAAPPRPLVRRYEVSSSSESWGPRQLLTDRRLRVLLPAHRYGPDDRHNMDVVHAGIVEIVASGPVANGPDPRPSEDLDELNSNQADCLGSVGEIQPPSQFC